jgi:hypothetical protein
MRHRTQRRRRLGAGPGPFATWQAKGSEPPLIAAQAIVLLGFLVVGYIAASRFRATGP